MGECVFQVGTGSRKKSNYTSIFSFCASAHLCLKLPIIYPPHQQFKVRAQNKALHHPYTPPSTYFSLSSRPAPPLSLAVPLLSLMCCIWVPGVISFGHCKGPSQANVLTEGIWGLTLGSVKDPGLSCLSVCPSHWPHHNKIAGLCKADLLEHNSP